MPARSVGLVVEGKTEGKAFKLLPKLLNDCPRLDGPAVVDGIGAEATPEQVARRVAKDVAFLQPDNDTVVVVVDRECRVVSAVDFAAEVRTELARLLPALGAENDYPYHVVVADRAFEAWLLGDLKCLAGPRRTYAVKCYEGHQRVKGGTRSSGYHYGDDVLKEVLGDYEKVRDGPRLFEKIHAEHAGVRCGRGSYGSQSFALFLAILASSAT